MEGTNAEIVRSGIGFGTCQRLIDEYLPTKPLTSHLILLPTTRSAAKSLETVRSLREYAERYAIDSVASFAARSPPEKPAYTWRDTVSRIHILSPIIDLCDLRALHALAERLCHGTMSNPEGLEGEYLTNVRIPRIDSLICNAAYGGWSGWSVYGAIKMIVTKGFLQAITYPEFKVALPTCILNERPKYQYPEKPLLGEVFTATIFGHYLLIHYLQPLLRRQRKTQPISRSSLPSSPNTNALTGATFSSVIEPGRVIFCSSIEAYQDNLNLDDIQCLNGTNPYEAAKRLTDVLALTYTLPSVRPISSRHLLTSPSKLIPASPSSSKPTQEKEDDEEGIIPPRIILTHPGIVASALFPVQWLLFWAYELALNIGRLVGSPWHNVNGYSGGKSAAWACLTPAAELDELNTARTKWGSSSDAKNEVRVKRTEVEGWGWEGVVENEVSLGGGDREVGGLRKMVGRKSGAKHVTERELVEFEEVGKQCWIEMERLREEWEDLLDLKG